MINLIHPHHSLTAFPKDYFLSASIRGSHSEVIIFWAVVIGYHAQIRDAIGLVLVSLWRADARERAAQTVHDT